MCVVIIVVVISFVALVIIKRKYFAKRKSNGKPLSNAHDHGEVKKKQSPTKQATEEIEMSVIENGGNISNDFEGLSTLQAGGCHFSLAKWQYL